MLCWCVRGKPLHAHQCTASSAHTLRQTNLCHYCRTPQYATSSADAEAVQTLQREQHGASGSVQPQVELWMPYTGPSPLNAPAHNKPGKHTSAAATLPGIDAAKAAKWGETQVRDDAGT
jgi:hypothetical protein